MLANKTLLSATLAATFVSGVFVGGAMKTRLGPAGAPPMDVQTIYAPQLDDLRANGYDPAEMNQAREAYSDYLAYYQKWWNQFLDLHRDNLDIADRRLEERLATLKTAHDKRSGGENR